MNSITSPDNNQIKLINKLKLKKYRERHKLFLLEGFKLIDAAIDASYYLEGIYILESLKEDIIIQKYRDFNCELFFIDDILFNKISITNSSQGILAICNMQTKESIDDGNILLLDRIQDPGNLGTIIRTSDAAGFSKVICNKGCADIYNPKTIRSTMGSIFNIPIFQNMDLFKFINENHDYYYFLGTSLDTRYNYKEISSRDKYALIIGNEGQGITKDLLDECDMVVKIPIYGKAESLNASVAAGIMMYHLNGGKR